VWCGSGGGSMKHSVLLVMILLVATGFVVGQACSIKVDSDLRYRLSADILDAKNAHNVLLVKDLEEVEGILKALGN
jgi:hypothetical protein